MALQRFGSVTVERQQKTIELQRSSTWRVKWQNGSWAILDEVGLLYDNYDTLGEVLEALLKLGNRMTIVAEA